MYMVSDGTDHMAASILWIVWAVLVTKCSQLSAGSPWCASQTLEIRLLTGSGFKVAQKDQKTCPQMDLPTWWALHTSQPRPTQSIKSASMTLWTIILWPDDVYGLLIHRSSILFIDHNNNTPIYCNLSGNMIESWGWKWQSEAQPFAHTHTCTCR